MLNTKTAALMLAGAVALAPFSLSAEELRQIHVTGEATTDVAPDQAYITLGVRAQAKEAGAAMIGYGAFATAVINFLILAFIIFLMVRYLKKVMAEFEKKEEAAPEAPKGPTEVELLTEIRDALKK